MSCPYQYFDGNSNGRFKDRPRYGRTFSRGVRGQLYLRGYQHSCDFAVMICTIQYRLVSFLTPDFFITICLEESEVLYPFISNQISTFYTYKRRFLFQILYPFSHYCSCVTCNKSTAVPTILKSNCVILQRIKTSSNCWNYRNP